MPQFVIRDVPPSLWSRLSRAMVRCGLKRQAAIVAALMLWCDTLESQQGGDTVASVPMGAQD